MSAAASSSGQSLDEPESVSTAGRPDDVDGQSRDHLVDQLIPAEPSRSRRFITALAVVVASVGLGLAWRIGWLVPQPSLDSVSQQSVTMGVAPDGEHVVIGWLMFDSSSLVTLQLTDIEIDAPGLTIDRITWSDALGGGPTGQLALPAEMAPGASIRVELWARPETCDDPTTEWGAVRGRWTYLDRPSWWGRWESLDNPLWDPSLDPNVTSSDQLPSALSLGPVNIDGEEIEPAGPLSAACLILGIDQ